MGALMDAWEASEAQRRADATTAVEKYAASVGMPAHNALGAPLVECPRCKAPHYCVPGDRNVDGRLCGPCTPVPATCDCWQLDCGSCGPRYSERPESGRPLWKVRERL